MRKMLLAMAIAAAFAAGAEIKVAFVDMADLLKLHPQYESDGRMLKEIDREYQDKIESRQDEIKNLAEAGRKATEEAQNPMLGGKARQEAAKKVEDLQRKFLAAQQELQGMMAKYREEVETTNARLLRTRMGEIREKTAAWAKEKGYDAVLDMTTAAYVAPELDVTDEILKLYGVDPAKRAEKKANESK